MGYSNNVQQIPSSFLRSVSIIHLALLAGQMLFAIVVFAQSAKIFFGIRNIDDIFIYIAPLLALGGAISGNLIFKQRMIALAGKNTLGEKITGYVSALITKLALLEGPSLFCIVIFKLQGNVYYMVISGMLMLYFLTLRPTKYTVENDLNLNFDEK